MEMAEVPLLEFIDEGEVLSTMTHQHGFVKDSHGEDTSIRIAQTQLNHEIRNLGLRGAPKCSEYEDLSVNAQTGNLKSSTEALCPKILHRVSSTSMTQNMLYVQDECSDVPITPVTSPNEIQDEEMSFDFKELENSGPLSSCVVPWDSCMVNANMHWKSDPEGTASNTANKSYTSCRELTYAEVSWADEDLLLDEDDDLPVRKKSFKSRLYRAESVQVPEEKSSSRRRNFQLRTQSVLDY